MWKPDGGVIKKSVAPSPTAVARDRPMVERTAITRLAGPVWSSYYNRGGGETHCLIQRTVHAVAN